MWKKLVQLTFGLVVAWAMAGCSALPGVLGDAHSQAGGSVVESAVTAMEGFAGQYDPAELGIPVPPEPYAYSQLDEGDKERYRILLDVFESRTARDYPDDDMDALSRIRDCVLADHPELTGIESVHMETTSNILTGEVTHVTVEGSYSNSAERAAEVVQAADKAADECFADLPRDADDYAKAKRAYEFLAERVDYVRDEEHATSSPDQTIEGSLANGRAVCGGYANAFSYLLQKAGVQCATVTGIGDGVDHAWCLAKLDGEYYFVDPTWGDPIDGSLDYDYLAITTEDAQKKHAAESPFELPSCTSMADNYYVREGLMFDYPDEIGLASCVAAGSNQVRCADRETYDALLDCVSSGRLANLLGVERYTYSHSDEMLTLKVYLN